MDKGGKYDDTQFDILNMMQALGNLSHSVWSEHEQHEAP